VTPVARLFGEGERGRFKQDNGVSARGWPKMQRDQMVELLRDLAILALEGLRLLLIPALLILVLVFAYEAIK
jgi:hypothetical protein